MWQTGFLSDHMRTPLELEDSLCGWYSCQIPRALYCFTNYLFWKKAPKEAIGIVFWLRKTEYFSFTIRF